MSSTSFCIINRFSDVWCSVWNSSNVKSIINWYATKLKSFNKFYRNPWSSSGDKKWRWEDTASPLCAHFTHIWQKPHKIEKSNLFRLLARLWTGRPWFSSRQGLWWEILLFAIASRPALGPTKPPIQWVPWAIIPEERGLGVKLTTHLMPKLRIQLRGIVLN
jgi:hypothetical protein